MPTQETSKIQNQIRDLGKRLGFEVYTEKRIHTKDTYAPVYDVIWYLNLEKYFDFTTIELMFVHNPEWIQNLKLLPFAGFEIEGSNTSSKNQLGNFANLYSGDFLYNFVIVNNNGAKKENDTYRRGVKLHRYFMDYAGIRNVFFFDYLHLNESLENFLLMADDIQIQAIHSTTNKRGTSGGETISIDIYKKLLPYISNTGLELKQNYQPETDKYRFEIFHSCETNNANEKYILRQKYVMDPETNEESIARKASDCFYIPKLDLVLGFNMPSGFVKWLSAVSVALKDEVVNYPLLFALKQEPSRKIFVPLISLEIETSSNKHLSGGIFNMAKNSYVGILVTEKAEQKKVSYYSREMGIKNVINFQIGEKV